MLQTKPQDMTEIRVSLAIPIYNEEAVVPELVRRTTAVLDSLPGGPHEIVFVDDGSSDGTLGMLEAAAERDSRIVVVELSRNFGHQTALAAALDQVSGDVVILMDGDLQDPPEAIPTLVDHYRQGYDVVYAQRVNRKEPWCCGCATTSFTVCWRRYRPSSCLWIPAILASCRAASSTKSAGCRNITGTCAGCAPGSGFARSASPSNVPLATPGAPSTAL